MFFNFDIKTSTSIAEFEKYYKFAKEISKRLANIALVVLFTFLSNTFNNICG